MWPFGKKEKKTKKAKKQKRNYPRPEEEHNFDKDLIDEEFFEVVDDN